MLRGPGSSGAIGAIDVMMPVTETGPIPVIFIPSGIHIRYGAGVGYLYMS